MTNGVNNLIRTTNYVIELCDFFIRKVKMCWAITIPRDIERTFLLLLIYSAWIVCQSSIRVLKGTTKIKKVKVINCSLIIIMYELSKFFYINLKMKPKAITKREYSTYEISTTNWCAILCVTNSTFIGEKISLVPWLSAE